MARGVSTGDVLGRDALNRALLARQLLLRRSTRPVIEAVEHLVGLQAQAPDPPYFGLAARLESFVPGDLARALLDRRVVRIVAMRGTVHLVSAADCLWLRPLTQPIMDRDLRANTTLAPRLAGIELPALAAAARSLLDAEPRTTRELGMLLAKQWPDRDPSALVHGARNLLPLVQVPPRGVWGRGGQVRYMTAGSWLGTDLGAGSAAPGGAAVLDGAAVPAERMVLRYLAAFGPATVADLRAWSGLTGLREVVEPVRPRLRMFRDENGRELFDLPDAPRPDRATPAPTRFVAPFDNLLLAHADRTQVISEDDRLRLFASPNGVFPGTILVDGFVRGTWKITGRGSRTVTLTVTPFRRLSKRHAESVTREGARLLAFTAPDAARDIRIVPDP